MDKVRGAPSDTCPARFPVNVDEVYGAVTDARSAQLPIDVDEAFGAVTDACPAWLIVDEGDIGHHYRCLPVVAVQTSLLIHGCWFR